MIRNQYKLNNICIVGLLSVMLIVACCKSIEYHSEKTVIIKRYAPNKTDSLILIHNNKP
jgi:hypothetical protein